MNYHRKRGWDTPAGAITPEAIFSGRRNFLAGAGALGASLGFSRYVFADEGNPYPAKRNDKYKLDREITPEATNLNYNNFYEFSTSKHINADALKIRPWTVKIDGLVEQEQTLDVDALIKAIGLEERLYRHRCVEAWSMAIPWTGFPLRALVEKARPLSSAKYVRFESFLDKKMAPGQRSFMPWPYVEGLTMAEATERSRLHRHRRLRQADSESAGRAVAARHAHGNMASSQQSRSFASALSPTGRRRSGRILDPTNTASGRTSIRKFPIRDGARRRRRN